MWHNHKRGFVGTDGGQEELLLGTGTERPDLELDHLRIVYGRTNTTLAWTIVPPDSGCNISRILSYHPCEQNSPNIDERIDDTSITIPSVDLTTGGQPADFAISSLNDQELLDCPRLPGTVRFNGKPLLHVHVKINTAMDDRGPSLPHNIMIN